MPRRSSGHWIGRVRCRTFFDPFWITTPAEDMLVPHVSPCEAGLLQPQTRCRSQRVGTATSSRCNSNLPRLILQPSQAMAAMFLWGRSGGRVGNEVGASGGGTSFFGGCCVPIRLTQTPTICRVLPLSRVKFSESRRLDVARDTKKRTEGVERVEPPVEAECELVEVGL